MTRISGQEPEVLLPPGADEVTTDALALLPHRQRQALRLVDALLHKLLAAAPQEAARKLNCRRGI
jgi:hypothetical protein